MSVEKDRSIEKEIHLLMAHRCKYDTVSEVLTGYKLPMLVKIAAKLLNMKFYGGTYPQCDIADILERVLFERTKRLDSNFEWTDKNKARFLLVSDQLYESCVKGRKEAEETAAELEKRIKKKDSFLKDYEIRITIEAYPKVSGEREAAETLEDYFTQTLEHMESRISHCHYARHVKDGYFKKSITINSAMNWNGEYFNGAFDNDYICYAIHYMLDTHVWSFSDIMSINHIWVDVEVTHQYETKIPKFKGAALQ